MTEKNSRERWPLRRQGLLAWGVFLALLVLAPCALGRPGVTVTFQDGRVESMEIRGFADGFFTLRNMETNDEFHVSEKAIQSIDFGETPETITPAPPEPPRPRDATVNLWRMANQGDYKGLFDRIQLRVRLRGTDAATPFREEARERLAMPGQPPEKRRDWRMALIVAHYGLSEFALGREELENLRREFPNDPEVAKFEKLLMDLRRRPPGGRRGPDRPVPRRRDRRERE